MEYTIFVVDDDPDYTKLIRFQLGANEDYTVRTFNSGRAALDNLEEGDPNLVLLDIMMPGMSGLETLEEIKEQRPDLPVVMVSAQGAVDVAVEAIKLGAFDYVTKGKDSLVKLEKVIEHLAEKEALAREVDTLRGEIAQQYGFKELIGESAEMQEVQRMIRKAANTDLAVAVQGESGTGKELVARVIHYHSNRQDGPFVPVNCAAIPSDLMESEFFGHEKGAFTDADSMKRGKFEQAHKGTLFLDEISQLSPDLQPKLLRALEQREITRVGGEESISCDVRIISATNQDLEEMIHEGGFREDLYYRLFQFPIQLPPLRERGQDPLILAEHFLSQFKEEHPEVEDKTLSSETRRLLIQYSWPGNVRELKNAVERGLLISEGQQVEPDDLMLEKNSVIDPWSDRNDRADGSPTDGTSDDEVVPLEELKRQAVEHAYHVFEGNVEKAAMELGIGRATMYRLIKKYDITDNGDEDS